MVKNTVILAGYVILGLSVVLITVAFSTPYWLEADPRLPQMKFDKLGLWQQCFRSIVLPSEPFTGTYFIGCRWLFTQWTTDYEKLREDLILRRKYEHLKFFFHPDVLSRHLLQMAEL